VTECGPDRRANCPHCRRRTAQACARRRHPALGPTRSNAALINAEGIPQTQFSGRCLPRGQITVGPILPARPGSVPRRTATLSTPAYRKIPALFTTPDRQVDRLGLSNPLRWPCLKRTAAGPGTDAPSAGHPHHGRIPISRAAGATRKFQRGAMCTQICRAGTCSTRRGRVSTNQASGETPGAAGQLVSNPFADHQQLPEQG